MKVEVAVLDFPVPTSPCGLCGRRTTLTSNYAKLKAQELYECRGRRP